MPCTKLATISDTPLEKYADLIRLAICNSLIGKPVVGPGSLFRLGLKIAGQMMWSYARCGLGGPHGADAMTPASSESLSHSTWDGNSHVVCLPPGRQQALEGKSRSLLGPVWRERAGQRGSPMVAGPMGQEHVPRRLRMPPQEAVAEVMGSRKGPRAIAGARQLGG